MGTRLTVTRFGEKIICGLFQGQRLISADVEDAEGESRLGTIYMGKVKTIVKNIDAAFVALADGEMCYLPLYEEQHPVYSDRFRGRSDGDEIRVGDEFLVQLQKEDVKTKAPVATTCFTLTGKYAVLVHGKGSLGISGKLVDKQLRKELKELFSPYVTETRGFIVRTNCADAPRELLLAELDALTVQYERLLAQGSYNAPFTAVYRTPPPFLRAVRDCSARELEQIVTDDQVLYEKLADYLSEHQREDLEKLALLPEEPPLDRLYGIRDGIMDALRERVWLKSGGYLIIQPTEAMTVVDVNTGKAVGGKKRMQETFFKINMEAAKELAVQIRLRNLSGIIIVDFIDMEAQAHREALLAELRVLLAEDPIKTVVVDMTALNLVELTRKKVRKPLAEQAVGLF